MRQVPPVVIFQHTSASTIPVRRRAILRPFFFPSSCARPGRGQAPPLHKLWSGSEIVFTLWCFCCNQLLCRALLCGDGSMPRPLFFPSSCARPRRGEAPSLHGLLSGLQIFQNFLSVALGLHVFENVRDAAVRADYEGCSRDSLHFLSVHVLLFDHAERLADFLIGVGK